MVYKSSHQTAPFSDGEAVDISSTDHTFTSVTRAIWVGTGGNLVLVTTAGTSLTLNNVQDGTLLPAFATEVTKTGTTASGMVGVW